MLRILEILLWPLLLISKLLDKVKVKKSLDKTRTIYTKLKEISETLSKFNEDYVFAISVMGYLFLVSRENYSIPLGVKPTADGGLVILSNPLSQDLAVYAYLVENYPKAQIKEETLYFDQASNTVLFGKEAEEALTPVSNQLLN